MIIFAVIFAARLMVDGVTIGRPACNEAQCPAYCKVSWERGCPNCTCPPVKYCPTVACPAADPICIIFTMHDGCQSCACKMPVAFLKGDDSFDPSRTLRRDNVTYVEGGRYHAAEGNRSFTKSTCTFIDKSKIDLCLRSVLDFHKFASDQKRDDESITINPMVLLGKRYMKSLCRLYVGAIRCVGSQTYETCRSDHPDLSEMHSLLSYACGPMSMHFFQHSSCIFDAHAQDRRLKLCEDLLANSLMAVQGNNRTSGQNGDEKCKVLKWFLKCARPSVHRYCSAAAVRVYTESFMSATEYMAPNCYANYNSNLSIWQSAPTWNKAPLPCSKSYQFKIYALFDSLYKEIRSLLPSSTPGFPVAYLYRNTTLLQKCDHFRFALFQLPVLVRMSCHENFDIFDQVYSALAYPCTQGKFIEHFVRLKSLRNNDEILDCEHEAERHLVNPSLDQCDAYNLLTKCMRGVILRTFGHEPWETHFQFLSVSVRRFVPDCNLRTIYGRSEETDRFSQR